MEQAVLHDRDFRRMQDFLLREAGISLSEEKRPLVWGRLSRRLAPAGCNDYAGYINLVLSGQQPDETQIALNLLTTNETHFFREPHHFEMLRDIAAAPKRRGRPFRVWSAASSSGEEAYSIAMVLAETLGAQRAWSVVGSDLSTAVLAKAQAAIYDMSRASEIPPVLLHRYCLRGTGRSEGKFSIVPQLRERVSFRQVNLNRSLPGLDLFDVIFLRNVLIYFDLSTKREVVGRVVRQLQPGGLFMIGHSETLQGVCEGLESSGSTTYRKPS